MDIEVTNDHDHSTAVLRRLLSRDPVAAPEGPAAQWVSFRESPTLAALLRLLGDPTRLRILVLLVNGEQSVMDLCRQIAVPQPTVSHHLAWLRASNLVVFRRDKKRVIYDLGPSVRPDGGWLTIGPVRIRLDDVG